MWPSDHQCKRKKCRTYPADRASPCPRGLFLWWVQAENSKEYGISCSESRAGRGFAKMQRLAEVALRCPRLTEWTKSQGVSRVSVPQLLRQRSRGSASLDRDE